jgi:hypothetical protein
MKRNEFAPEQWRRLAQGPAMAAYLIMESDPSNPVGKAAETTAGIEAFREAIANPTTPVMTELFNEFGSATPDDLKKLMALESSGGLEQMRSKYLSDLRANLALVREKGGAADGEAYAKFVMHVAGKVANAAKEGGFLGFGGQEISKREAELLDQLRLSLGV